MKLSLFSFLLLGSLPAFASPVACPDTFLMHLEGFDSHLRLAKEGSPGIFQEDYDSVIKTVRENPSIVNCVDLMGTPLTYALNMRLNICSLPYAAEFLLEQGAEVNQIEPGLYRSPLYVAVEMYGSIFGTPEVAALKNEDICAANISESRLRNIIGTLLSRGANQTYACDFQDSVPKVAASYQVQFLLK